MGRNIFTPFTEWGTQLLSRLDLEPFLRARLLVAFSYLLFAACLSLVIGFFLDAFTAHTLTQALLHPELIDSDEAIRRIESLRWFFRVLNLIIVAVGVYFLVGITLRPIREATEFQKRFIANISHELRTPLTVAKTEAEVALRNQDNLTKEDAIALLKRNVGDITRVARIIQFLATLSDLSDRRVQEATEPLILSSIAARVHEGFLTRTTLPIKFVLENTSDGQVWGNAIAIEKLIVNLLRNAIAHTPEGGTVTLGTRAGKNAVVLYVEDTGVGIPIKDQKHLFEPFFKASNSTGEGTGLGLSIVKEIARVHNARLSIESEEDKGTIVSVQFPLQ